MAIPVFTKDPDETRDYGVDWTNQLSGSTISSSSWTVPSGITESSSSNTTSVATIILSGGTEGNVYQLTNQVTLASGLVLEQSIKIAVESR